MVISESALSLDMSLQRYDPKMNFLFFFPPSILESSDHICSITSMEKCITIGFVVGDA